MSTSLSGQEVVVIYFNMQIEDLVDTDIMQVMEPRTAKEVAKLLLDKLMAVEEDGTKDEVASVSSTPELKVESKESITVNAPVNYQVPVTLPGDEKLELILDIPLKVEVVLGRSRRPVKEILNFGPGAIIDLDRLVDEDVEVLVNGTLVARGEIVVVGENFGVKINQILSPSERLGKI